MTIYTYHISYIYREYSKFSNIWGNTFIRRQPQLAFLLPLTARGSNDQFATEEPIALLTHLKFNTHVINGIKNK